MKRHSSSSACWRLPPVSSLLPLARASGGWINTVSLVISLVTLVMVFAIQHTSSREARALNVKLDELIRVSEARNELIGAEDESHVQLNERRGQLLAERRRTVD